MMKQALLLEDFKDAQVWLQRVLEAAFPGIQVRIVASIQEADILLHSFQPDIALIDLNLPDGSGVSILQTLSRQQPDCITVVTTIYDDDEHLFSALSMGAHGYLLKEQPQEKMIQALQGLSQGRPALSPQIANKILHYFSEKNTRKEAAGDKYQNLTQREEDVLKLLAAGKIGKEIADILNISYHTVASHIKNIYQKQHISSRAEAVQRAMQMGLLDD